MSKSYKLLLAASLIANFGCNMIGPFYAVFVKNIGGSILDIGFSTTLFWISSGILVIIVGKLSDRLDKELITIVGYALYALATLLYLAIRTPWQLFILQGVFALATACLSAPLTALFSKYIQKKKKGEQWGFMGGGSSIAVGVAVFIGTLIVNRWGFEVLFSAMFLVQIIALAVQLQFYFAKSKKRDIVRGRG